jgi:hypothetical protein
MRNRSPNSSLLGVHVLFSLSLSNDCFKSVNHEIYENRIDIWHLCLCHINVGWMPCLASMSLIPKVDSVKGFKDQVCMQSK